MPEGDTIFRAAAKLRAQIQGREIRKAFTGATGLPLNVGQHRETDSRSDVSHAGGAGDIADNKEQRGFTQRPVAPSVVAIDPESLSGQKVESIEARGKHLLMHLTNACVIHSHMGMDGAWHVYRANQKWQKPVSHADLVLQFEHATAVCFLPKLLELLTAAELKRHRWLRQLGPDLLATTFDVEEAIQRFRRRDEFPIGEAVMNQAIVSGIGNVYKSELLFLEQLHPLTKVGKVPDETLASLLGRARKLMQRNVMGGPRRTRFRGDGFNLWVYGRQGEACLKCGETIRLTRQGNLGRTTYYCPECQPKSETDEIRNPKFETNPNDRRRKVSNHSAKRSEFHSF